ncbi:MAG: TonB-dependent receptor, partial [Proteobacteria bacterium]|nr:TonB-dependent receptor [Pseudomonadota bacterium]
MSSAGAVERWLAWRYLATRQSEGFVSFIAVFSLIGVALGVATLIVVLSVMGGFRQQLLGRIVGINGHVVLTSTKAATLDATPALVDRLIALPGVRAVRLNLERQALVSGPGGQTRGALLRGVRPDDLLSRPLVTRNIANGSLDGFGTTPGVVMGERLRQALGARPGDKVTLVTHRLNDGGTIAPRYSDYEVLGSFVTRRYEFDGGLVFVPLAMLQDDLEYGPNAVTSIDLDLADPQAAPRLADEIRRMLGRDDIKVSHWLGLNARFVGALQGQDSWVDVVDNKVGVAYGTIQADLTENTTATFSISHMQRDITPFNGLPTGPGGVLLNLPRSTFTGADWNHFDNRVTDYIAEVEHKFDGGGHAKLSARYSDRDVDFLYAYAGAAANAAGIVPRMTWLARDFKETSLAIDAHVSKPFELWGQEHNVILGADYRKVGTTTLSATGTINGPFDLRNWNSAVPMPNVVYNQQTDQDPTQFGIYGQLRVKPFERLTLIGGGRLSWYDATTINLVNGAVQNRVDIDAYTTPYAGAVLDLTDWLSAYASYTHIFQPQVNLDAAGNVLDPREGRQYEIGLKAELFDGGINASIAYFNLRDTNRAV